ncbi:MAG: alpha/beta fold hydrolase [Euzebya sp.]
MSTKSTVIAATGGLAAGAALVTFLTGRSRPAIPGLERLDPPSGLPPARVVALPGRGEMFFRDQPGPTPDSPTVVLLHGWLATADLNWFTAYSPLADVGRVIAPDHRGHGRGVRHSQPYRLADVADDVAALLRHLDTGPAIIVGYSMGGPITQLLWQRHPDVVAGMVLCATAAHFQFGPLGGAHWRLMSVYQVGSRLLPRTWLERVLLAQMKGVLPVRLVQSVGPELAHLAPLLPWVVGEIERGDVEDMAEAGRELGRFDSRGWMRGMHAPAALVVTTRDRMVPPNAQLELAGLLPHALVTEVAADHDAPAAVPLEFAQQLTAGVSHVRDLL